MPEPYRSGSKPPYITPVNGFSMRIGLDFDNTIACYEQVFHKVAVEKNLIPPETPMAKVAVRNYLRSVDNEDAWTELQGYVYGARMADVAPFPGALETLSRARDAGHELYIVSHKTKQPFLGPQYDLHEAAQRWILEVLKDEHGPTVPPVNISFREKKSEKIARIADLEFDVFVDDLPEILTAPDFPESTRAILFDPGHHHRDFNAGDRIASWSELGCLLGC